MTKARRFRKMQTLASIAIFFAVFASCLFWNNLDIQSVQLSHWGIKGNFPFLWNACLVLLSVSIYINFHHYLSTHSRAFYKRFFYYSFLSISIALFFTGLITMDYDFHDYTAFYYFFAYPFFIFAYAHMNRKHLLYREWFIHNMFSILMILCPLVLIKFFPGMAIPESAHSFLVMGWNLWLLRL